MSNLRIAAEVNRKLQTESSEVFNTEEVLFLISQLFHYYFEEHQKYLHPAAYRNKTTYSNVYLNRSISGAMYYLRIQKEMYDYSVLQKATKEVQKRLERALAIINQHQFPSNQMTYDQHLMFNMSYLFYNCITNLDLSFTRSIFIEKMQNGAIRLMNTFDEIKKGKHVVYHDSKHTILLEQYEIKTVPHLISNQEMLSMITKNPHLLLNDYTLEYGETFEIIHL